MVTEFKKGDKVINTVDEKTLGIVQTIMGFEHVGHSRRAICQYEMDGRIIQDVVPLVNLELYVE